jgi:hypothetical protein
MNCADATPEEMQGCVLANCAAELGGLSDTCMGCLQDNAGASSEEVAAACSPPPAPTFACEDGELTPLGECKAANCADATPEEMQGCVLSNCAAEVGGLSQTCLGCVQENAAGSSEEIAAACAPPSFACPAGSLAPLGQCTAENCADATPEEMQTCVFSNCAQHLAALPEECTACLTEHAGEPSEDVAAACQAPTPLTVCEAGELSPLVECASTACDGLPLSHQAACLFTACQNQILGLSRDCMGCLNLNDDLGASVASCEGGE